LEVRGVIKVMKWILQEKWRVKRENMMGGGSKSIK